MQLPDKLYSKNNSWFRKAKDKKKYYLLMSVITSCISYFTIASSNGRSAKNIKWKRRSCCICENNLVTFPEIVCLYSVFQSRRTKIMYDNSDITRDVLIFWRLSDFQKNIFIPYIYIWLLAWPCVCKCITHSNKINLFKFSDCQKNLIFICFESQAYIINLLK